MTAMISSSCERSFLLVKSPFVDEMNEEGRGAALEWGWGRGRGG